MRAYHVRPGVGVDLYDVSLTLAGAGGGLSLIAADTLELDFQAAEILGPAVRLRRAVARGLEVYHTLGPPAPGAARKKAGLSRVPRLRADALTITGGRIEVARHDGRPAETVSSLSLRGAVDSDGRALRLAIHDAAVTWDSRPRCSGVARRRRRGLGGRAHRGLAGLFDGGRVWARGGQQPGRELDLEVVAERAAADEISALIGIKLEFQAQGALARTSARPRTPCTSAATSAVISRGGNWPASRPRP